MQTVATVLVVLGESFLKDLHGWQGCNYPRVQGFISYSVWARAPAH